MAEPGRTRAINTNTVDTNTVDTSAVNTSAARTNAVDSVTVVLRGTDTARARMPTPAERDSLRLGRDVPVWVVTRAGGDTELYPADSTVIVPAG
jgi:hypothetical protein